MQITSLPATPLVLPGGSTVSIATQQWTLERWTRGDDPPDLKQQWASSLVSLSAAVGHALSSPSWITCGTESG